MNFLHPTCFFVMPLSIFHHIMQKMRVNTFIFQITIIFSHILQKRPYIRMGNENFASYWKYIQIWNILLKLVIK